MRERGSGGAGGIERDRDRQTETERDREIQRRRQRHRGGVGERKREERRETRPSLCVDAAHTLGQCARTKRCALCSKLSVWLFSPAWDTVKLTCQDLFCPFVVLTLPRHCNNNNGSSRTDARRFPTDPRRRISAFCLCLYGIEASCVCGRRACRWPATARPPRRRRMLRLP
jgi:hypothetical protein